MVTRIKSEFIEKYFGHQVDYLEHDGPNGSVEDDTLITVAYKPQDGGQIERILLKELIKRTISNYFSK